MALKGKRKSRNRGSQARRRPASAPRPTSVTRKPPWYRTTGGLTVAGLGLLVLLIFGAWLIANTKAHNRDVESKKKALETYTEDVRAAVQSLTQPVTEMTAAAQQMPDDLKKKAQAWQEAITATQTSFGQKVAPGDAVSAQTLFQQAIQSFTFAAIDYGLVP
ncbi:MAG TPA: hypothetical protein VFK89_12630, partial [Actinomycetota bacterium]|nr:hypothetical protein [Actinomycetota bacterium]